MNEDSVVKEEVVDRIEKVFFQLLDLFDRQSQERQLLITEKEQLGKLTELLISQTKEIGHYEAGIRKRIQDCIKEASIVAIEHIEETMQDKITQSLQSMVDTINQRFPAIESDVTGRHREKPSPSWKMIGMIVASSIMISFAVFWFLMPKTTLSLTSEQINYLQEGQMLTTIWPKLTKAEKDRISMLFYETLKSS